MNPARSESPATPDGVDVSIVATVYKSATMVEPLIDEIVQVMSTTDYRFEILLVDDSSPDHSWTEIVRAAKADPRVRGIRLRRNRGQQIAASAGIENALGNAVVLMDGDLQNPVDAIPEMLRTLESGKDVVYAVSRERNNWKDQFTSWLFWFLLQRIFRVAMVPHQLMLRAMKREVVDSFDDYTESVRTIAGIVDDISDNFGVIQVRNRARREGRSNYNICRRIALMVNFLITLTNAPLTWIFGAGIGIAIISVIGSLVQTILYFTHEIQPGFTSIILVICFFGSLTLVSLGFLGRYLSTILVEVKRRPLYRIARTTQHELN